ncbi:amino acid permease 3 (AAP3) [Leptomonas pyrrhocoris]|uniref:Amino acid permease 3 (AAP3) n=1 Tax=Leptomonas pyrrhocoris TaxID=157538 RepID=A0A0M9FYZ2_LEPPY|nr:amino acid permease 3 (AAP3) [Leptomonas pyrrhocoris]XP_015657414.1 amino acid permease 3 (AAP3) [Leptomonas pyrrhocoris]KPA78973.1 amino acid permease 3 (AAP3) [Leptomonas pyrrhocoris]KPA78975.1 amino acid permease 3 (AAP3) [Leptomonas pyrrhocoris]|eukprot:XP_015657412.1 amino acid permease 3 (AAP3) [Leptomonas pyrrhocoris]
MRGKGEPIHHDELSGTLLDHLDRESPTSPEVQLDRKRDPHIDANVASNLMYDEAGNAAEERPRRTKNVFKRFSEWLIPYGGLVSNCFSLGSVTLGGGIISMPSSFAMSGIVMSIIYLVVITAVTVYSMTLMGYAMEKTGVYTYEELAHVLFGRGWDYFAGFVLWLSCFGTAVAYISAVSSLIDPILRKSPGTPAYLLTTSGNRLVTSLVWLVLMMPVIIPKHVNSIRYVSAFGVVMVLYFVVTIVVHSSTNGMKDGMRGDMQCFTVGNKAIYGLSIFIFAYLCQVVAGNVYHEQRPRPSVKQLTVASAIAMTVCMMFYILAGVFGYFDFADDTQDSILFNFDPVHQPYMMVAYIGMLVKLCAAYAMNMVPCRNFIYHCLSWNIETLPYWKHILVVLAMSVVILICGLFIPSINTALGLVGSLCGGFIGFLFPAYYWMYCGDWSIKSVGIWHWLATYFLVVCGVIAIVLARLRRCTSALWYSSLCNESATVGCSFPLLQ